jgi:hypothetical protein
VSLDGGIGRELPEEAQKALTDAVIDIAHF